MKMIYLHKPQPETLASFLNQQSGLGFSYDSVGATATVPPPGFNVDRTRVQIGRGESTFRKAKAALLDWQQFRLGWVDAWSNESGLRTGQTIAILGRGVGLWWLNACRVVYVIDESSPRPESAEPTLIETSPGPSSTPHGAVLDATSSAIEPSHTTSNTLRFGFANGTLPGHIACGEERFLIEWDPSTDQVWYDILAFSKPSRFLSRLGYPWIRLSQRRFREQSSAAMLRAVR